MSTEFHSFDTIWEGIALQIIWTPNWYKSGLSHIELRSEDFQPLPITGTGYRSHFCAPEIIEQAGGPVAFVLAALDLEATKTDWIEAEAERQQLSLF